jgi:hypothetical protein
MSDQATPQDIAVPAPAAIVPAIPDVVEPEKKEPVVVNGGETAPSEPAKDVATEPVAPTLPLLECKIAISIVLFNLNALAE